jgi:hypothetical protein
MSFVGVWAADPAWCASPMGERQPIRISATRFEGYENRCEINSVTQSADGYVAILTCQAEGVASDERLALSATPTTLKITWLDRGATSTEFTRCPAR